MNALLVADDFPFSPFIGAMLTLSDTRDVNIVGVFPNLALSNPIFVGGLFYQDSDDPETKRTSNGPCSWLAATRSWTFMPKDMNGTRIRPFPKRLQLIRGARDDLESFGAVIQHSPREFPGRHAVLALQFARREQQGTLKRLGELPQTLPRLRLAQPQLVCEESEVVYVNLVYPPVLPYAHPHVTRKVYVESRASYVIDRRYGFASPVGLPGHGVVLEVVVAVPYEVIEDLGIEYVLAVPVAFRRLSRDGRGKRGVVSVDQLVRGRVL